MSTVSRSHAAAIARETVGILAAGRYTLADGTTVRIRDSLAAAVAGTVDYPPGVTVPQPVPSGRPTAFEVRNETTLAAAARLAAAGLRPVALNFASAKHPGGGFRNGARAQEESLCRASGLFAFLDGHPMYAAHAGTTGGFYTDSAVYSPAVPVFRDDAGWLLSEPYPCGFVTCPAVNAGRYLEVNPRGGPAVRAEMARRVAKVLAVMAAHGHPAAVLGAWGCGVFRNDPEMVADMFREAFAARFAGVFERVVFAVLDPSADEGTLRPFADRFAR